MQLGNADRHALPRHAAESTIGKFLRINGTGSCQEWCTLDRTFLEAGDGLTVLSRSACCAVWDTHKLPSVLRRSYQGREAEAEDLGVCNGPLASPCQS